MKILLEKMSLVYLINMKQPAIFLVLLMSFNLNGFEKEPTDKLNQTKISPEFNKKNLENPSETESPLRRAEILFFISVPYIFLTQTAIVALSYYIATKDANFRLPKNTFYYIGATTLLISGGIIYSDYRETQTIQTKEIRTEIFTNYRF